MVCCLWFHCLIFPDRIPNDEQCSCMFISDYGQFHLKCTICNKICFQFVCRVSMLHASIHYQYRWSLCFLPLVWRLTDFTLLAGDKVVFQPSLRTVSSIYEMQGGLIYILLCIIVVWVQASPIKLLLFISVAWRRRMAHDRSEAQCSELVYWNLCYFEIVNLSGIWYYWYFLGTRRCLQEILKRFGCHHDFTYVTKDYAMVLVFRPL